MQRFIPLSRRQVRDAVSRDAAPPRVPVAIHFWVHPHEFGEREARVHEILDRYPEDIQITDLWMPDIFTAPPGDPTYRWLNVDVPAEQLQAAAFDDRAALEDWSMLEGMLAEWPDPAYPGLIPASPSDGRYRIGKWWFSLFERHWMLRGMTNALMDYHDAPDRVHQLYRALTDFYLRAMERAREELGCDAIMVGDDLGTQTGCFFSMDVFDEFYRPYYTEMIRKAHELGMHFWLHCCGRVDLLLEAFIEMGLDVIHPIQKHAMDQIAAARAFRGRIAFWAGLDVQQVIPWGTPDEVRQEVRGLIDAFNDPVRGGLVLTAGNGINEDCSLESLEAFLDEAFRYGSEQGTA